MSQSTINRLRWTLDEYHCLIKNGLLVDKQVELLNGEIIEMAPEGILHADLSNEATEYLRCLLGDRAKIRAAKPITLERSEPELDLCVCRNVRYSTHHPYPEDIFWLIEYSDSSLTKDLEVKSAIYAAASIPEYWVVNLKSRKLIVLRQPEAGEYEQRQTLSSGSISPLAFPDILVEVVRLIQ
jgi:Uma2 family endonuclease